MADERYLVLSDLDGSSNAQSFTPAAYDIIESGQVLEREFGFEGTMGETVCPHTQRCPNHYFSDFDTSDGTLRLPPLVTTIGAYDISYLPTTMWEDWDAAGLRAFYIQYRDTTTTPDIIVKKFRVSDNALVDTETSPAASAHTAPRMGAVAVFEGATYIPPGDESGTNNLRKLATVGSLTDVDSGTANVAVTTDTTYLKDTRESWGDLTGYVVNCGGKTLLITSVTGGNQANGTGGWSGGGSPASGLAYTINTADTWEEGDADVYASSLALIDDDGVAKFVKCTSNAFKLAASEPKTTGNYSGSVEVGDSSTPMIWTVATGGFVYAFKPDNLYELDTLRSRPLLNIDPNRSKKPLATYDDFDGHMGSAIGTAILYPCRRGFFHYQNGRERNVSVDEIPGFRAVPNVSNVPIGLRHYATEVVGRNVYSIYKPSGLGNTQNCHIMYGYYDPMAERVITWRNLITRERDLLGLFRDSDNRLNFVENPNDPAVVAGTATFDAASSETGSGTSLSWSHTVGTGTQRLLRVVISANGLTFVAPSSVVYGTQSMTYVTGDSETYFPGRITASMWQLVAPESGTKTITAQYPWYATQYGIVGGADSWSGVYQSEPIYNVVTATGTSTAPSVTVTSAVNDVVVDGIAAADAPTAAANQDAPAQTERWDAADSGNEVRGAGSTQVGATSVVMSWLLGASKTWVIVAGSIRPGSLGLANADLNYLQLAEDGSPRTALGRNRGAASTVYEHVSGDIYLDHEMQARYMRVETEGFTSTTSLQLKVHRDGGIADSIGSAIITDDFHKVEFTPGTTDSCRRIRQRLTLTTNSSYAPTTSDPRILRSVLGLRGPDLYRAAIKLGKGERNALAERKKLRKRKGAGMIRVKESWTGTQYRADVFSLRDMPVGQDGEQYAEILIRRWDCES